MELTKVEYELILTSLECTKLVFEAYPYPTFEMKLVRIKEVEQVIEKVRKLKKESKCKI